MAAPAGDADALLPLPEVSRHRPAEPLRRTLVPIRNVRDAMSELGQSPHIQSRAQAIAVSAALRAGVRV